MWAGKRENIKKNILKEYLFGFPDDLPWQSVIMSGLVLSAQSFPAKPQLHQQQHDAGENKISLGRIEYKMKEV